MAVDKQVTTNKPIVCVECKKVIGDLSTKAENLTEGRIGYYFTCDNCGQKYPFAAISEESQKLLKKIKRLKKDMKKFPTLRKSLAFTLNQTLAKYNRGVEDTYDEEDVVDGK